MKYPKRGRLLVVVGGQFGSEGKGHLTAQLAERMALDSLVIRTGGPNAGHTVWSGETEYKLRHLPTPVAIPSRPDITIALAAKSVIDPYVLREELALFDRMIAVDPAATILEVEHVEYEQDSWQMEQIGSTRKGIGAARADRIKRTARTARDLWDEGGTEIDTPVLLTNVRDLAYSTLARGSDVLIEAAQGYGLGLHTPFYPYCTSADCTALDALADAQISPWAVARDPEVWMAIRPYPIRVAGTSGPLRDETTWEQLGLPPERTTVTNRIRRVGHWDKDLARQAAIANGVWGGNLHLGLMMADQVVPKLAGITDAYEVAALMADSFDLEALISVVSEDVGAPLAAIGTGPKTMAFAADLDRLGFGW